MAKESLLEYMQRRLKELREMKVEVTTTAQHMFPDCEKYKPHCCSTEVTPEEMKTLAKNPDLPPLGNIKKIEPVKEDPFIDNPLGNEKNV